MVERANRSLPDADLRIQRQLDEFQKLDTKIERFTHVLLNKPTDVQSPDGAISLIERMVQSEYLRHHASLIESAIIQPTRGTLWHLDSDNSTSGLSIEVEPIGACYLSRDDTENAHKNGILKGVRSLYQFLIPQEEFSTHSVRPPLIPWRRDLAVLIFPDTIESDGELLAFQDTVVPGITLEYYYAAGADFPERAFANNQ